MNNPLNLTTWINENAIPLADRPDYYHLIHSLENDLQPNGVLEIILTAEIFNNSWRLRRLSATDESGLDAAIHKEFIRSRNQTNNALRRNLAELRRLQAGRRFRDSLDPERTRGMSVLMDIRDMARFAGVPLPETKVPAEREQPVRPTPFQAKKVTSAEIAEIENRMDAQLTGTASEVVASFDEFTKRSQSVGNSPFSAGRNAPCPCGSGQKFKRCCGHWSPTSDSSLKMAA